MGKFTPYKLPLKSMSEGKHSFRYELGKEFFQNMENADIHDASLVAELEVTHKNDAYTLDFHITGEVTLLCDRCLDTLQWPIDQTYHIIVKYGDDYCDDSDEVLEIPHSDNDLNVAYMLHDTVVLAIPIKHVHPLGKCNRQMSALLKRHRSGLQGPDSDLEQALIDEIDDIDASESEKGSDPRWDALRNLSSTEEN